MSVPTQFELEIFSTALIVLCLVYALVKHLWNLPLRNGSGFFLGVEVPQDFYEGPGRTWLKSYRATLAALHMVLAVALGTIIVLGRWDWTPIWAGGTALLRVPTLQAFAVWTRHKLGAYPPVRPVAIALTSRRLGDYISWPMEALMAAVLASSWWLLLRQNGMYVHWLTPLQTTWVALVLPGKILLVRSASPLPAERTEEHYRYQDAVRRNGVNALSAWGWLAVVTLFGYALQRAWSPASTLPWLRWLNVGVFFAVFAYMMIMVFRGMRMAATVGRDLRPSGSWVTPFRCTSRAWMSRPYQIWFVAWFGGILALSFYSSFR
jgi:hypothetical protein